MAYHGMVNVCSSQWCAIETEPKPESPSQVDEDNYGCTAVPSKTGNRRDKCGLVLYKDESPQTYADHRLLQRLCTLYSSHWLAITGRASYGTKQV